MGYYNYLCELLRPLRVYRLDEGSLSGAELYAAGEGLDAAAEALEKAAREGVLMTAEDEGFPAASGCSPASARARRRRCAGWRSRRCCALGRRLYARGGQPDHQRLRRARRGRRDR
ncbi:MAG: hypothetical protein ACLRX4_01190 [Oscillospiraceae bacterium]